MKALLDALEDNLRKELEVQHAVQANLDRQLDILLEVGSDNLPGLLESAEQSLAQSQVLEEERSAIIGRISDRLQKPVQEITLDTLEAALDEYDLSLREVGDELKEIVLSIRESNRQVGLLVRHSVLFIDELIHALTGRGTDPSIDLYTSQGQRECG